MSTKYYLVLVKLEVRLLLVVDCCCALPSAIAAADGKNWWVSCGERLLSGQRSVYALWGRPLRVARPCTLDWRFGAAHVVCCFVLVSHPPHPHQEVWGKYTDSTDTASV